MLLDISILPQTSEELFYFVTKRIPYLCGFWRFANAYNIFLGKEVMHMLSVLLDTTNKNVYSDISMQLPQKDIVRCFAPH